MLAETFIVIGFILIALAILFALPFFGIGMVIPIAGDVLDLPISFVFGVIGAILVTIGLGLAVVLTYWWIALIIFLVYIVATTGKIGKIKILGDS